MSNSNKEQNKSCCDIGVDLWIRGKYMKKLFQMWCVDEGDV